MDIMRIKDMFEKIKLFIIFWVRIVFAKNHFNISFFKKLKANFGGGYLADQYVLYDFDNNDKNDYLSEFDWYRSRIINNPFNAMLNNKVICTDILKHHFRVPEIYFVKTKNKLTNYINKTSCYEDIILTIEEKKSVYLKPISAGQGVGVTRLNYRNEVFYVDDQPSTKEDITNLLLQRKNWFLTETINQAEYLNRLYEKTTNTLRMITLKDFDTNEFYLFFTVQRIGTSRTIPVDNGSRGGLVSKVNLETGELSEAKSLHNLDTHTNHPDSNYPIKGTIIPNWLRLKEDVIQLANKFPYLNFVAWDILVTEQGPVIIEANTSSGVNIIQIWGGQKNGELGNFYRKHGIIK